ncbi:hypothetical protein E2C01_055194 [Portunus trituberculatus]|uniref:Uncharacterized protein n=1 Tax=Portunus trituberculatus TaxID=210409 RepID=A0A5B7GLU5_PORTR|nr:hypothetical protein [Portunus trituberculatus]
MEVGICHTAPMPGSQTPFQDVEAGVCHMAPMPGGQLIIPSRGLGVSETIPRTLGMELGTIMSDGLLSSQSVSVGASHKAPMLGNQTYVPCVGVSVCPLAPMPDAHHLPRSGVNLMDPGKSVPNSFPLFQEDSVETC